MRLRGGKHDKKACFNYKTGTEKNGHDQINLCGAIPFGI
jgi:hypothetical protein